MTYTVSATGVFRGNENSIADLGNGTLYMNGRGTTFPWKGHRTSYWSHDDGATWSPGAMAPYLAEPNTFGCDASLIAIPNTRTRTRARTDGDGSAQGLLPRIFFAEPAGPGERVSLRVWCSTDGGLSFTAYTGINKGAGAGYSAMSYIEEGDAPVLVVVWEASKSRIGASLSLFKMAPNV